MVQKHTTAAFYDRNATVTDQETLAGNTLRRFRSRREQRKVRFLHQRYVTVYSVHRKVFSRTFSILQDNWSRSSRYAELCAPKTATI